MISHICQPKSCKSAHIVKVIDKFPHRSYPTYGRTKGTIMTIPGYDTSARVCLLNIMEEDHEVAYVYLYHYNEPV